MVVVMVVVVVFVLLVIVIVVAVFVGGCGVCGDSVDVVAGFNTGHRLKLHAMINAPNGILTLK